MHEEAGGSSQNAGQHGDVLPVQPQLVAAVTKQVLQALSKGSDSKRQRAPSSSMFINDDWQNSHKLNLYTDAAGRFGYGAVFGTKWFCGT